MGSIRVGLLGLDADIKTSAGNDAVGDVLAGGDAPGILGADGAIPLDDIPRIIARVTKDWEPPSPGGAAITVGGTTLLQAANALNAQAEWGQAGGRLLTDTVRPGNTTNLTINLHAHLIYRLPTWTGYTKASQAVKDEWDRMVGHLKAHEDRHLQIAIEEANQLAKDLVGHDIDDIADMVTEANRRMNDRQEELDNDTDHGARAGVAFGDVILDISIK